jgi:putative membrane protein
MTALLADFVIALVALEHLAFLALEMFLWDKPPGLKVFRHSEQYAASTKALAANQGLYNGFLAAGLFWGLVPGSHADSIKIFFLSCVIVAGVYGAISVSRRILLVQAAPAALGLLLVVLA